MSITNQAILLIWNEYLCRMIFPISQTTIRLTSYIIKKGEAMNGRRLQNLENMYKISHIRLRQTCGLFQIPKVTTTRSLPTGLINFKDAMKCNSFNNFVHFYLDDSEFECIWRTPERYIKRLKLFNGVLTPDFSLYIDMPTVVQAWNIYRSRILGCIFHEFGCKVIPTISWSDTRSYSFAFDGIKKNSVVSVSSVGIWREQCAYKLFLTGLSAMIEKINPASILFYGKIPEYDFGTISVKQYLPDTFYWKKRFHNVYYQEK